MGEKLCKKEIRKEKGPKTSKGTGSPIWKPGFQHKNTHRNRFPQTGNRVQENSAQVQNQKNTAGTGSPKLGTGFQGTLPESRQHHTQQEPVPPNWEPGSRALCPSSKCLRLSGNRFLHFGNRVPQ